MKASPGAKHFRGRIRVKEVSMNRRDLLRLPLGAAAAAIGRVASEIAPAKPIWQGQGYDLAASLMDHHYWHSIHGTTRQVLVERIVHWSNA